MDQHKDRPAPETPETPGTSGGQRPPRQEDRPHGPVPVWGGTANGPVRDQWQQRGQVHDGQAEHDGIRDSPAAGWGTPSVTPPAAGWGTTTAGQADREAGTGWGRPEPQYAPDHTASTGNRNWTAKKGLIVGGVAVAVAAAAGAGAYAAGNSQSGAANAPGAGNQNQLGPGGQAGLAGPGGAAGGMDGSTGSGGVNGGANGGMAGGFGGPGGLGMGMGGLLNSVHSEYVVLEGSTYVTMAGQTGTVTAISGNSLSVKSADGFTRTYAVDSSVQVVEGVRQRGGSGTSTLSLSDVATGATVRVTAQKSSDTYTAQTIEVTTGTSAGPGSGTTTN